jgi:hypothetical protein
MTRSSCRELLIQGPCTCTGSSYGSEGVRNDGSGGNQIPGWTVPHPCQKQPTMADTREYSRDIRTTAELPACC